jgi:hypothetical protein
MSTEHAPNHYPSIGIGRLVSAHSIFTVLLIYYWVLTLLPMPAEDGVVAGLGYYLYLIPVSGMWVDDKAATR